MTTPSNERPYQTDLDLSDALVEAIQRRDKLQIANIGLYALTTEHDYPLDGTSAADYTDYIWGAAAQQLKRLDDPAFAEYFDENFPQITP
jgi:hypothetical protein